MTTNLQREKCCVNHSQTACGVIKVPCCEECPNFSSWFHRSPEKNKKMFPPIIDAPTPPTDTTVEKWERELEDMECKITSCKGFNCLDHCPCDCHKEKWNENVEDCSGCGIHWKKIGHSCPVCFTPPEKHSLPPQSGKSDHIADVGKKVDTLDKFDGCKCKDIGEEFILRPDCPIHGIVSSQAIEEARVERDREWRKRIETLRLQMLVSENLGNAVFRDLSKKQNELTNSIFDALSDLLTKEDR